MANRPHYDDPSRCAACGARDVKLRPPTVPAPHRANMRVCVEDKPCADRFHAARYGPVDNA